MICYNAGVDNKLVAYKIAKIFQDLSKVFLGWDKILASLDDFLPSSVILFVMNFEGSRLCSTLFRKKSIVIKVQFLLFF